METNSLFSDARLHEFKGPFPLLLCHLVHRMETDDDIQSERKRVRRREIQRRKGVCVPISGVSPEGL